MRIRISRIKPIDKVTSFLRGGGRGDLVSILLFPLGQGTQGTREFFPECKSLLLLFFKEHQPQGQIRQADVLQSIFGDPKRVALRKTRFPSPHGRPRGSPLQSETHSMRLYFIFCERYRFSSPNKCVSFSKSSLESCILLFFSRTFISSNSYRQ